MQPVRELSRQLRALASRSRLEILQILAAQKAMTVTELRGQVHISQPLLSWHLSILRRAGLVDATKDGRQVYYAVNRSGFQQVSQGLDDILGTEPDADAEAALAKQAAGSS
ncbi:MAG: metalloregulator ArsR/SmtB family transcription factor [Chloroflexota bacterium]|nr:metalloregulator ArsR/SmtB family transcription factor [Chloroflexota bacterium]MDE2840082.1 metalloregulator ArsR/SmtB family transcription factor [Chloroflexota bacterium]MDE2930510.1 metalloregulator ArsR/SmtB family transcription factor [Chloroflexota bacterium]